MKVKNIDVNKFKKIKSFALVACLVGTMTLSGCGNINQGEQLSTDNSIIEKQQEEKMYEAELIYSNTDNINENETITITYIDDEDYVEIYAWEKVHPAKKNSSIDVPVSEFSVISDICGSVDVSLEEDQKAVISVDYLTKKMSVEEVKIEKGKQK